MPRQIFFENQKYYHIYNRGVEKRSIFLDEQDYSVFLSYLENYLSPKDNTLLQNIVTSPGSSGKQKDQAKKLVRLKNYFGQIELLSYALLPNHFHLLVKQKESVINSFTNSLGTRYAMYFNKKYQRTGVLFQDVYKAVLVSSEEQLLYLSKYIHLNPVKWMSYPVTRWREVPYPSSLADYINGLQSKWICKEFLLKFFSKNRYANSYADFILSPVESETISRLTLD